MKSKNLPPFSNGHSVCEEELYACSIFATKIKSGYSGYSMKSGSKVSKVKGRGMEFSEVRLYQNSDDIRNIDWKVTARTGKTHTKIFCEEKERNVFVCSDLGFSSYIGSNYFLKSTQIAHVTAAIGWSVIKNNDILSATVGSQFDIASTHSRSGRSSVLQLIDLLIKSHSSYYDLLNNNKMQADNPDFNNNYLLKILSTLRRTASTGSLVWVVTDGTGINQDVLDELARLKNKCEVIIVLVYDSLTKGDFKIPYFSSLSLFNGSHNISLSSSAFKNWIKSFHEKFNKNIVSLNEINLYPRLINSSYSLESQIAELR